MSNVDINVDGRTDGRTDGQKIGRLYRTLLQAGAIKMTIVCVEVLRPSQPNGVMSSAVSLPNHTFTGQA